MTIWCVLAKSGNMWPNVAMCMFCFHYHHHPAPHIAATTTTTAHCVTPRWVPGFFFPVRAYASQPAAFPWQTTDSTTTTTMSRTRKGCPQVSSTLDLSPTVHLQPHDVPCHWRPQCLPPVGCHVTDEHNIRHLLVATSASVPPTFHYTHHLRCYLDRHNCHPLWPPLIAPTPPALNKCWPPKQLLKYRKVTRPGIEPRTFWTYTRCSNQLSYLALEFTQPILYLCNCQPKDTYSARHIQCHSLHARSTLSVLFGAPQIPSGFW